MPPPLAQQYSTYRSDPRTARSLTAPGPEGMKLALMRFPSVSYSATLRKVPTKRCDPSRAKGIHLGEERTGRHHSFRPMVSRVSSKPCDFETVHFWLLGLKGLTTAKTVSRGISGETGVRLPQLRRAFGGREECRWLGRDERGGAGSSLGFEGLEWSRNEA